MTTPPNRLWLGRPLGPQCWLIMASAGCGEQRAVLGRFLQCAAWWALRGSLWQLDSGLLLSRKIFLGSICDVLYDFYGFFICMHTHILTNRFSGLERGMSPDLWWLTRCFRCILQILRGMEWLVMIGHPSESETRSQGAELDLLAWLCQELSGCKSVGFQHWGGWSQLG